MAHKTKKKANPKAKLKAKGKPCPKPKAKKPATKARDKKPRAVRHSRSITIKITPADLDMIISRAERFAGGNVSKLLRHAANVCKTKAPASPAKSA